MATPQVIDAHMHIYRTKEEGRVDFESGYVVWEYGEKDNVNFSDYDGDLDDALNAIERSPVSKAVVMNLFTITGERHQRISNLPTRLSNNERERKIQEIDNTFGTSLQNINEWICREVAPYPQFVPFISADPIALPGEAGANHIQHMVETKGARGIKLHPILQDFNVSDSRMFPIYTICEKLNVPILVHSGPAKGGIAVAEPKSFARALGAFPNLSFILAHMGGGSWQQLTTISEAYPNAFFDCCEIIEWTGATNAPSKQQLAQLIKDVGPERVIMGSDFPWYDLENQIELIMDLPVLSLEEKEGILGPNAERILSL